MKRYLMIVIMSFTLVLTAYAKEYRWNYNLCFDAPEEARIAYNSRVRLEMVWHDMAYIVNVCRNVGDNDELLKRDLQRTAADYNMWDTRTSKYSNKSFIGFCLHGTLPDGSTADIYNLQSKKTQLCIQVIVNYTRDSAKDAQKLIKSIKEQEPPKKKKPKVKQKVQKKNAPPKPIKKSTTSPAELYEI